MSRKRFIMVDVPCKSNSVYVRCEGVEPLTKSTANRNPKTGRKWTKAQSQRASRSPQVARKCILRPNLSFGTWREQGAFSFSSGDGKCWTHYPPPDQQVEGTYSMANIKCTKTIREVNLYCSCCGNPLDAYHTAEDITNLDTGRTAHIEMIEGTCRQSKSVCLMSNQTLGPSQWMDNVKLSNYDGSPCVRFNVYSGEVVESEVA